MATMRAARLIRAGEPLSIEEIPVPVPAGDEVLVRVRACGLCGTDIHLAVVGDIPAARTPITLGHEGAGEVAAVGPSVKNFKVGDRVALLPAACCGVCRFCRVGRESLCEESSVYGMIRDGALAEYIAAPARSVLPLPDAIPFDIAAIVTDGVSTPFHALRSRGRLAAGETVAVVGCGGLGTHAIILARLMGASLIVAIDPDEAARKRATELGADLAIDPKAGDPAKALRNRLGRRGVDLSLEFVGHPETVETAVRLLDKAGRAVVAGVGMGKPTLPPLISFVGMEQAVIASFGMDRRDIEDLLALIASGHLDLHRSVSARYPLAKVNDALGRLASRDQGVVRLVVEP
ncbi:MAG: alcohol dehydrogenase catalytic domain-containing protein [Hyphomicrobiaceae bacterium]|nr:MAG: alcohol dehydrogenase catalytic domain-containing protein [Hyphomicrobiaceae bacterium]